MNMKEVKFCSLCHRNGEAESLFRAHNLKTPDGRVVTCPVLRNSCCTLCGATKDSAHTLRSCPLNKDGAYNQGAGLTELKRKRNDIGSYSGPLVKKQKQKEAPSGELQEAKEGEVLAPPVNVPDTASLETFKGKFQRISAEKLDEVLKALSVGFMVRKAATYSTPVMEIRQEERSQWWVISTHTSLRSGKFRFLLEVESEEVTADGREVTSLVSVLEGGFKAVQRAKNRSLPDTVHIWQMTSGDYLVYTLTVSGGSLPRPLVSTQTFKRMA